MSARGSSAERRYWAKGSGPLKAARAACRKSPPAAAFCAKTRFPCAFGAAGETCKETLLRKASESTAHVAGFGIPFGGLRPSKPHESFFDSLTRALEAARVRLFFFMMTSMPASRGLSGYVRQGDTHGMGQAFKRHFHLIPHFSGAHEHCVGQLRRFVHDGGKRLFHAHGRAASMNVAG